MARHDHQLHEGEALRKAARDRLTREGEQWTDMRASVFDALAGRSNPARASNTAARISVHCSPRSVIRLAAASRSESPW
jgi:Fur family zinc uptake transcriptional regulator